MRAWRLAYPPPNLMKQAADEQDHRDLQQQKTEYHESMMDSPG